MGNKKENIENKIEVQKQCPVFPFFGATYPDAACIDGWLWDLDSDDSDAGGLTKGGEDPCPFCNRETFIQGLKDSEFTEEQISNHLKWLETYNQ